MLFDSAWQPLAGFNIGKKKTRWAPPRSGDLLAKAENVAVTILDVKIEACPRCFLKRLDHFGPAHFVLATREQHMRLAGSEFLTAVI